MARVGFFDGGALFSNPTEHYVTSGKVHTSSDRKVVHDTYRTIRMIVGSESVCPEK